MISQVHLEQLNLVIKEIAELYSEKVKFITSQYSEDEDPVWKQTDIEELTKIKERLNLLFKIRDSCLKVLEDLETLKSLSI